MKVYAGMDPRLSLGEIIAHAKRVEALGYDGIHVAETVHDSLGIALLVAEHTSRLIVRTSVALAFTRSPTLTAYAAWDLSKFSGGRFQLGLGTQIRQNIVDRYAMPFSTDPLGQLRDYVGAVRSCFATFRTGERPAYESGHYSITRMQPYFNPGPDDSTPEPPIYLGGVQYAACALAGEMADGFVSHPTNSNPRYLTTTCRPGLEEGAGRAGRVLKGATFELVIGTQIITGPTTGSLHQERERQRRLLAFLYSTPAYRPTLELYGWEELGPRLRSLIHREQWDDLGTILPDDILDTLVPCATFDELPALLVERFRGLGEGIVASPPPDPASDDGFRQVIAAVQAA